MSGNGFSTLSFAEAIAGSLWCLTFDCDRIFMETHIGRDYGAKCTF